MSTLRTIAVRLLLMGLLFIGYWTAWRPMRGVVLNEAAVPVLQWSAPSEAAVQARGGPVRITLSSGTQTSLPAPAGIPFLLPALFLVAAFPKHGYWLFFWAGHCLLFACMVAAWSAALMAWPGAFGVADFLQTYGVDLYSLGVPVALWVRHRQHA
ncbi:hypothetical protein CRI93_02685 [Longimonas halophila]|uniref:Uncharacterized protein n=1 Tax=Longimonas halophila TaxID=1469170 RepID=A0A2H3P322_9BACT|nr:hypothetical protein [Longimonas halophila]PEN08682.1 hypothetical protein CRI93_02685 [Longimonas halophila]